MPEKLDRDDVSMKIQIRVKTSLKSSAASGAVRISLRAKLVRVLPTSARSERELATLQSTRNVPSTATVRRERPA